MGDTDNIMRNPAGTLSEADREQLRQGIAAYFAGPKPPEASELEREMTNLRYQFLVNRPAAQWTPEDQEFVRTQTAALLKEMGH